MNISAITNFLDKNNLPWFLLFLFCWWLIWATCTRKQFYHALPVGIWTMVVGTALEHFFIFHKFWVEKFIMIPFKDLDLFVCIGPFFAIGIMLVRFNPKTKSLKFFNIVAWSALATLVEFIAIELGFLAYTPSKWTYLSSFGTYMLSLHGALGFYSIYYTNQYFSHERKIF